MPAEDVYTSESYVERDEATGHYVCRMCGQSSAQKHVVHDHVDGQHIRLRRYKCEHCPEVAYTTKYMLRRHRRDCHK
jgi:hypothetical protein